MEYRGPYRVRATHKPEPRIERPADAIVQVQRSCICGSDLHLYPGLVPAELQYNRDGTVRKAAVVAGVLTAGYLLCRNRRR